MYYFIILIGSCAAYYFSAACLIIFHLFKESAHLKMHIDLSYDILHLIISYWAFGLIWAALGSAVVSEHLCT
jgi:hypothetical protein